MALLERVATLVRANLNDLVDKAENPEKMIKQVILDMENQLLQVKTQVAISIADQHVLEKKLQENEENTKQWMRRAELAVDKKDDALARAAVERSMSYKSMTESFRQQVEDQKTQVENLKTALLKLQQKLAEAQSKSDMLIAQHRRSRALGKATEAGMAMGDNSNAAAFDRMKNKVQHTEAAAQAHSELAADNVDDQFAAMEKAEEVDRLLADLKNKRKAG
ncbi:MAG TPA: PspA/IM30 family protein [Candidatus Sulfopaludibacter sp.]|jgi:phage shock protein A|nr:PspA/IM30 family protein [Candidatus Sulfopaludibacter sp.]